MGGARVPGMRNPGTIVCRTRAQGSEFRGEEDMGEQNSCNYSLGHKSLGDASLGSGSLLETIEVWAISLFGHKRPANTSSLEKN